MGRMSFFVLWVMLGVSAGYMVWTFFWIIFAMGEPIAPVAFASWWALLPIGITTAIALLFYIYIDAATKAHYRLSGRKPAAR